MTRHSMAQRTGAVEVRDLIVDYGEAPVLQNVQLQIPAGQFVLITGPSGCGKSTLARVLAGLIPHAIAVQLSGRVVVDQIDTQTSSLPELARHTGIVLQNPSSQLFHLSVAEEIAFGPRNLGLPEESVQQRVSWAMAATGLQGFGERRPTALSGGEQQRVAIAAVLAMQPRVLILDEPTASLDLEGTRLVLETLRRLNRQLGMTIILIEHRLATAIPYAQRLLLMDQGRIVADGAPQTVLRDRKLRDRLGLRRTAGAQEPMAWRHLLQAQATNGQEQSLQAPAPAAAPLLRLRNITAGYRDKTILRGLDLTLYPGEFAAIVGHNGSGKSTLARVIAGLLRPAAGDMQFQVPGGAPSKRPRPGRDVALLFQNPLDQLFTDTVEDEIAYGPLNFAAFERDAHQTLLQQAGLDLLRDRSPMRLSVGQQQRCVLAACLALQPPLLILDEPTLGQDWAHLQQLMDFVQKMNERGTTILLISHDYKLVYRYARRVLLLENGRIGMDGSPQPQQAAAQLASEPLEGVI